MTSVRPVFATVFNFRDLGGHRVEDGRTVAYGRLFRSDSLHRITVDEGRQLAELGVRTVLDLRRPIEIEHSGRITAELGLAYHNIHPLHRPWDPDLYDESAGAQRYLADRYLDMAEEGRAGLGEALQLIAAHPNLLRRPIATRANRVVIGCDEAGLRALVAGE